MWAKHKQNGFTIIELLIVIVVIGILAAITIVAYNGIQGRAVAASLTSDLDNASKLLKLDQVTGGAYPATLALANSGKNIPASPGTVYQYNVNNNANPQFFCITATKSGQSYKIANDGTPSAGDCTTVGLILYLDAGNPASYPGSGTSWADLSGSNNNATLVNGVGYVGTNGGSFSFDGIDDYVNLSAVNTAALSNSSVSFWRKSPNSDKWLLFGGQTSSYYLMAASTGNFYHSNSGTSITIYEDGINVLRDARNGIWHNYVATGVNLSSWTVLNLSNYATYQYNGMLSDVRIYNRALTTTEIQQNFNTTRDRYGV